MSDVPSLVTRPAGPRRLRALVTHGLCAALACVWALASVSPVAAAAPQHAADSVAQQAVQLDSPAVTRIVSEISASLTCAGCASDGSDIRWPFDGSSFTFYSSGSGAFISPDGAILTADHVVDHSMNNPEDVNWVKVNAAQDIESHYNTAASQTLATAIQQNNPKLSISFQTVIQEAFLSTAYIGTLTNTKNIHPFTITSIAASSPVNAHDTAIVRIDTKGISPAPDFPYLTLANSTVNPLDNITAIAFPAKADYAPNNTDFTALMNIGSSDVNTINSLLTPSVNNGTITKANATLVYEASNIASNGSSGGPVINGKGQVIGFVHGGADNLTIIIPSTIAAQYATQAGISSATTGRFMSLWTRAMSDYNATTSCHWTNAATDLTTLKTQYPNFGGVAPYLAQAKQSAATESCATSSATTGVTGDVTAGLWLIGGCVVALGALVLGMIFLMVAMTRRKRPQPLATRQYAGSAPARYIPQASPAAPQPPMAPGARVCPNGHMVVKPDATFCPNCGAPLTR